jgi:hypothetical protein
MGQEDSFTLALNLAEAVMVHASGRPAVCLAVTISAVAVFVGAYAFYSIKQAIPVNDG